MPSAARSLRCAGTVAGLATLCAFGGANGQEWHDFRSARQVNDVRSLEVHLLYAAGRLSLGPSEGPLLYDAKVHYDAARFEPYRSWRQEDDHGRLRLALSSGAGGDEDERVKIEFDDWEVDFNLDDIPHDDTELGDMELQLHRSVPTALKVGAGASQTRLELGDLTLTSVEVVTGASKVTVEFAAPNRTRMEQLSLKSAAAEFRAVGLGNARFDHLDFGALIGDVTLDFAGEWDGDATAKVKMGLGQLVIRVPSEIGVRIERKSVFTSFEADDFQRDGNTYVSPNWDSAAIHLDVELDAGLVSVEVQRT